MWMINLDYYNKWLVQNGGYCALDFSIKWYIYKGNKWAFWLQRVEKGKDRPRFGRPNRTETVGMSKWALTVSVENRFGPARVFGLGPKRKKEIFRRKGVRQSALGLPSSHSAADSLRIQGPRISSHSSCIAHRGDWFHVSSSIQAFDRSWKFCFCLQN